MNNNLALFPPIKPKTHIRTVRRNTILRKFPNFRSIMSQWEEILLSHEWNVDELVEKWLIGSTTPSYETYTVVVDYPNQTSFYFTWNIEKLAEHINKTNMQPVKMPVDYLLKNGVYEEAVEKNFIPQSPHNPIIFIKDINNHHSFLCINGNNRIAKKRKIRNSEVELFLFEDDSHSVCMETKFEELFWKFSSDMLNIEKAVKDGTNDALESTTTNLHLFKEIKKE